MTAIDVVDFGVRFASIGLVGSLNAAQIMFLAVCLAVCLILCLTVCLSVGLVVTRRCRRIGRADGERTVTVAGTDWGVDASRSVADPSASERLQPGDLAVLSLIGRHGPVAGGTGWLGATDSIRPADVDSDPDALARLRLWNDFQARSRHLVDSTPWGTRTVIGSHGTGERSTVHLSVASGRRTDRRQHRLRRGRREVTVRLHRPDPMPMVRVLGPIAVTGAAAGLTVQQTSLVTLLLLRGPQSKDLLMDGLWAGRAVSDSRFANLVTDVRRVLGKHRLQYQPDGRYRLEGVAYDLDVFTGLVAGNDDGSDPTGRERPTSAASTEALSMIRGRLFDRSASKYWRWVDDDHHVAVRAEQLVAAAALRSARLSIDRGDHDAAVFALEKGLMAIPGHEELVALMIEIHGRGGRARPGAGALAPDSHPETGSSISGRRAAADRRR